MTPEIRSDGDPVRPAADGPGEVTGTDRWPAADSATATPVRPDSTAAAFFDVDNTLLRGASIYYFARGLAARDLFTMRELARFGWGQMRFRVVGTENRDHMDAAKEAALAFVTGRRVDDLVTMSEEIYDDLIADRIWSGTRNLAQRHLDTGQRVWLVTAAPIELAAVIARRLGLSGALGTVAAQTGGVYNGELVGTILHGPAKAEAIQDLAAREGLVLSRCSAYSDSANDVPMLSTVGHPYVVNPDSDLRDIAKRQGWPVFDFRTGRRVTLYALACATGAGATVGAIGAGLAVRRAHRPRWRAVPLVAGRFR